MSRYYDFFCPVRLMAGEQALEQLQALILPAFIARPLLRHYPSPRHKLTRACHIYLGLLTG